MTLEREKWIDVLKGIAIILVVFHHSCASIVKIGLFQNSILSMLINGIDIFHVELFMELSGFVFWKAYVKDKGIDSYRVLKQLANLIIIYLFFSMLRFAIKFLFDNEVNNKIELRSVITIPFKALDELWYLYAIIILYCICLLLFLLNNDLLWFVFFTASVLYNISGLYSAYTYIYTLRFACFFLYGAYFSKNLKNYKNNPLKIIIKLLMLIICIIVYNANNYGEYISNIIEISMAFLICNLLVVCCMRVVEKVGRSKILEAISFCGKHTLPIYLFHIYITSGFRPVIRYLDIQIYLVAIVILSVTGVIVPLAIYQLLKKFNLNNIVFNPVIYLKMIHKS